MGTGTEDMVKRCKDMGLKLPAFIQDTEFRTILYKDHFKPVSNDTETENVPENVPENRRTIIIKLIQKNAEISMLELSKKLNVNEKTIKRDIQVLKSQALLKRIGPDKGGYWKIT